MRHEAMNLKEQGGICGKAWRKEMEGGKNVITLECEK